MFVEEADRFKGNNNFEYDLIDVVRQAVAEKGRLIYKVVRAAYEARDPKLLKQASDRFLELLLAQDRLLATRPEFKVGSWIEQARSLGHTGAEKRLAGMERARADYHLGQPPCRKRRRAARLCPPGMERPAERLFIICAGKPGSTA